MLGCATTLNGSPRSLSAAPPHCPLPHQVAVDLQPLVTVDAITIGNMLISVLTGATGAHVSSTTSHAVVLITCDTKGAVTSLITEPDTRTSNLVYHTQKRLGVTDRALGYSGQTFRLQVWACTHTDAHRRTHMLRLSYVDSVVTDGSVCRLCVPDLDRWVHHVPRSPRRHHYRGNGRHPRERGFQHTQ
jgi:hypothetical protein